MDGPPDVPLAASVRGRFVERRSRFHVAVETAAGVVEAHLANSGRLRELLHPGVEVRLTPRTSGRRRTAYDLTLVRIPGDRRWASVDARLPPRIVAAALARGAIPQLAGWRVAATEPRHGRGRLDLHLVGAGGELWVETKSTTLVEDGTALFPDSPTDRGRAHLEVLAGLGDRAAVVFVVQRPDAVRLRAHADVDPGFAAGLRRAAAAGVRILAGVCAVEPRGIRWLHPIPVDV